MSKQIVRRKDVIQKALYYKNRKDEIRFLSEVVNSDFLQAIKFALEVRGINPSKLAKDIRVSKSYVSQVLNGTRMINIPFITRIRKEYQIPLELVDTSRYVSSVTFIVFLSNNNIFENYPSNIKHEYVKANTIDIPHQEISMK
jgi:transcriptional regulator with XRE-family HTH domain